MKWIKVIICYLFSLPAFANLPYQPIQFPRDDAAHHANVPYEVKHLTESWYFTGKIRTNMERNFGYFIAVYHIIPPGKSKPEAAMMMQLTNLDNNKVYGVTQIFDASDTIFSTDKLDIRLGKKFSIRMEGESYLIDMQDLDVPGLSHPLSMLLSLTPDRAPLLMHKSGLINMYDNTNTYYYTNMRMRTQSVIVIGGVINSGISESSTSWMDHQWGDFILTPQKRWIRTNAQFSNGMDVNAFELIDNITKHIITKFANVIMPDDARLYTDELDIQATEHAKSSHYPAHYQLKIHPINLQINLDSLASNQNINGFWEGAHEAVGQYNNSTLTGFSYVENTVEYQRHK